MNILKQYFKDPMFQRQIIMEHYKNPKNRGLVDDDSYLKIHMDSESCIDDIHIQVKLEDEKIKDVRFDGEACTIATSTTSILIGLILNKSREEALKIIDNYLAMVDEKDFDETLLEEALVYQNIYKQANRIKCATLSWNGIKELLEGE
jgi:nitrogen fixation NifU-like protein